MKKFSGANGFLFIGDPHVPNRKPGRRKDKDFTSVVLNKVEQCIKIANDNNLVPVFLGDIYNDPKIESESTKTRLLRILKQSLHQCVSNLGNHERANAKVSDEDSISYLKTAGAIDLIDESGPYAVYDFGDVKVGLGGTPYGEDIPRDVSGMFGDCNTVVWVTHHDLDIGGTYPNAIPTHEIKGCKVAVNGHMHLEKPPKQNGETLWFNPGNITRQAIDAIDHTPRVYGMDKTGQFFAFDLEHTKDVFDLTGRLVTSISEEMDDDTMESVFVQLIQVEQGGDFAQTEDGVVIRETIETKFEQEKTDPVVKSLIVGLLNDVIEEAA